MPVRLIAHMAAVVGLGIAGCGEPNPPPDSGPRDDPGTSGKELSATISALDRVIDRNADPGVSGKAVFKDVAQVGGIEFQFYSDVVPNRYFLPEIMGGGAAWFDFDRDGLLDLYLMNGAVLNPDSGDADPAAHSNQLFRNVTGDRFENCSLNSTSTHHGYGQGCSVADYNSDGFPDIYLTNYGANVLLQNNGDGTFSDRTADAGVGDDHWGTSTVWLDINDDNFPDLYVVNYLNVTLDNISECRFNGVSGYCGPGNYESVYDAVFVNEGDGTFREASAEFGLHVDNGKGLAVAVADFDEDRRPEIYVANDMTPNFFYSRNRADGSVTVEAHATSGSVLHDDRSAMRYVNVAASAGCAVSDVGQNEASMGIACSDFDGDSHLDIFLTHFFSQKNTLYRNLGNLLFEDDSRRSRVAATSFETLGFGTVVLDFDRDGADDLFVTNGHVLGPAHDPFEMLPQLLHNDGTGRFDDASSSSGKYFRSRWVGRGAAAGDYDNDGDIDILVTHLQQPIALLNNQSANGSNWIGFDLRCDGRGHPAGARVTVQYGDRRITRQVIGGGSYLCHNDVRLLLSLPGLDDLTVDVRIDWPSGNTDEFFNVDPRRYWLVLESRSELYSIDQTGTAQ